VKRFKVALLYAEKSAPLYRRSVALSKDLLKYEVRIDVNIMALMRDGGLFNRSLGSKEAHQAFF